MDKIKKYLQNYNKKFSEISNIDEAVQKKIIKLYKLITDTKKKKKKIIIAGNGGSAAIASHFSVDMTKNNGIRCINFNESDLLTCFSNDYGYQNWVKEALRFYADRGDLIILISSSGKSQNMINAAKFAKSKKNPLVTLTGFFGKNELSKYGSINFIVNSKSFNFIENTHQYWLLSLVDIITEIKK
mgnify:CR=1 FL=1|tara:strand:+ start:98 stop:655 length:558 start_codon:yes stop_codon:yes gene_type:complete